jgi:hypothetical protein
LFLFLVYFVNASPPRPIFVAGEAIGISLH